MEGRQLRDLPFDGSPSISFASLLLEAKQTRRAANVEYNVFEVRAFDTRSKTKADRFCNDWDVYDFLAVAGIIVALIGLALVFIPATRAGGVLFPVGAALTAAATYGAHRRDQATD